MANTGRDWLLAAACEIQTPLPLASKNLFIFANRRSAQRGFKSLPAVMVPRCRSGPAPRWHTVGTLSALRLQPAVVPYLYGRQIATTCLAFAHEVVAMNIDEVDTVQLAARDLCGLAAALQAAEHLSDPDEVTAITDYAARQLWGIAGDLTRIGDRNAKELSERAKARHSQ